MRRRRVNSPHCVGSSSNGPTLAVDSGTHELLFCSPTRAPIQNKILERIFPLLWSHQNVLAGGEQLEEAFDANDSVNIALPLVGWNRQVAAGRKNSKNGRRPGTCGTPFARYSPPVRVVPWRLRAAVEQLSPRTAKMADAMAKCPITPKTNGRPPPQVTVRWWRPRRDWNPSTFEDF